MRRRWTARRLAALLLALAAPACWSEDGGPAPPVEPVVHYGPTVKLTRDGVLVGELRADSSTAHPDSTAMWFYGAEATFRDAQGNDSGRIVAGRMRLQDGVITPFDVTARVGPVPAGVVDTGAAGG